MAYQGDSGGYCLLTGLEVKVTIHRKCVEQGKSPARIIAAHQTAGKPDRTLPICPYPQFARYNGSGSIDDASNFTCRLPQ